MSIPTCIGTLGQHRFTHGMLNICHARIAPTARRHVPSPFPSGTRLWSTLYPCGAVVADAPTSGYEKPEFFCLEMKRQTSSSDGAVSLNNGSSLSSRHAHFVDGWKLVAICTDEAANQFSAGKVTQAQKPDAFVGSATFP
jgi:hypothetical protein